MALAIFMGPDAYVTPSWYASKREHSKVVPTWNYEVVQAFGHPSLYRPAFSRAWARAHSAWASPGRTDSAPRQLRLSLYCASDGGVRLISGCT